MDNNTNFSIESTNESTNESINIFDTTDILGKKVLLTTEQYNQHIVPRHPEMKGNGEALKETIEDPHVIIKSKQNPDRWLYIGKSDSATYPNLKIKTVV